MTSDVYVTASGPALSLLMYENTKASTQVGFLLGAVINQVTDTISDSQISGEKMETIINISSVLPMQSARCFSNGAGKLNYEKLFELVEAEKQQQAEQDHKHDIVGWYCFNRGSSFRPSLWEKVTHEELSEMSGSLTPSAPEHFVLCLLSSAMSSNATHVYKHSFLRYLKERRNFVAIPLHIQNLGQSQQMQYQVTASPPSTTILQEKLLSIVGSKESPKDLMLKAQQKIQELLNSHVVRLAIYEQDRFELESEVADLRDKLRSRIQSQSGNRGAGEMCSGLIEDSRMHPGHSNSSRKMETDNGDDEPPTSPVLLTSSNGRNARLRGNKSGMPDGTQSPYFSNSRNSS